MLPTKFQVSWPFCSGDEVKNRFSRWWPSQIYYWNDFSYFLIYKSAQCFLRYLKSTGLSVQEKKPKIDFQDGGHGGDLGFPIGTILAFFFIYKSPPCFLPSFKSISLSVQKKQMTDLQDGGKMVKLYFLHSRPVGQKLLTWIRMIMIHCMLHCAMVTMAIR